MTQGNNAKPVDRKSVPIEPTEEMLAKGHAQYAYWKGAPAEKEIVIAIYKAMLAASPPPEAVKDEAVAELFDRLLNRSSRCSVQDGTGDYYSAVKAKRSDLLELQTLYTHAASAEGGVKKWCEYCEKETHNDSECWCTRPADWTPRYKGIVNWAGHPVDAMARPPANSAAGTPMTDAFLHKPELKNLPILNYCVALKEFARDLERRLAEANREIQKICQQQHEADLQAEQRLREAERSSETWMNNYVELAQAAGFKGSDAHDGKTVFEYLADLLSRPDHSELVKSMEVAISDLAWCCENDGECLGDFPQLLESARAHVKHVRTALRTAALSKEAK